MKKDSLTKLTKYLLDFMFYAGILVTVTLPVTVRYVLEWISERGADSPFVYLHWGIGQYYVATVVIYFFLGRRGAWPAFLWAGPRFARSDLWDAVFSKAGFFGAGAFRAGGCFLRTLQPKVPISSPRL